MAKDSPDGAVTYAAEGTDDHSQPKLGVLFLGLAAILTFFGAVGLMLYLKPGGNSPAPAIFVAGPLQGFAPGSVIYFQTEHLYVVRLAGGEILALYDLDPRMQGLLDQTGDKAWLNCRAELIEDADATRPGAPPAGFDGRVFREPCHGSTWDASGARLFGPAEGNLERFPVSVVEGVVHVDVANRRCVNEISDLAPCLPTQ
jgi:hypothetical protein